MRNKKPPVTLDTLNRRKERLARKPTDAEKAFLARLTKARITVRFQHVIPPYIVDFLISNRMLIIELDGEVHAAPEQARYDQRRDDYLKSQGFTILRLSNTESATWPLKNLRRYPKCKGVSMHTERLREGFQARGMQRPPRDGASQSVADAPF